MDAVLLARRTLDHTRADIAELIRTAYTYDAVLAAQSMGLTAEYPGLECFADDLQRNIVRIGHRFHKRRYKTNKRTTSGTRVSVN